VGTGPPFFAAATPTGALGGVHLRLGASRPTTSGEKVSIHRRSTSAGCPGPGSVVTKTTSTDLPQVGGHRAQAAAMSAIAVGHSSGQFV
jgi:hypothetical protein